MSRRSRVVIPGVCRVCGCTELCPCIDADGLPCTWIDEERTLCDSIECLAVVPIGELEQLTLLHREV